MATKIFLKLDGVKGESKNARHINEIEVLSWSWGGKWKEKALASGAQQGELLSKMIEDLNITKEQDKTTQILLEACTMGKVFKSATLTMEQISSNGSPQKVACCGLKNLMVTSQQIGAGETGKSTEFVTFSFEEIKVEYAPARD